MKKMLLITACICANALSANAYGVSNCFDKGIIYSGSSFPNSVSQNAYETSAGGENLKRGESSTVNILGLVETGDGSIRAAARNGGISKIHYVDTQINKIYIPLIFVPIYAKQIKTIVYGE